MPGVYQMRDKQRVSMSKLSRFTKKCLGYGSQQNESLYAITAKALEHIGYPKTKTTKTDKAHVKQHYHIIVEYLALNKGNTNIIPAPKKRSSYLVFNDFYKRKEWRELRYKALLKSDGKCCVCGASKQTGAVLHVDHIKPRYKYPDLELCLDNLQVLCEACNMGKGGWDETDWREPKNEKETT